MEKSGDSGFLVMMGVTFELVLYSFNGLYSGAVRYASNPAIANGTASDSSIAKVTARQIEANNQVALALVEASHISSTAETIGWIIFSILTAISWIFIFRKIMRIRKSR